MKALLSNPATFLVELGQPCFEYCIKRRSVVFPQKCPTSEAQERVPPILMNVCY
jgi:hypothetical protein